MRLFSRCSLSLLLIAALLMTVGCGKEEPISSANSGLRPDEDTTETDTPPADDDNDDPTGEDESADEEKDSPESVDVDELPPDTVPPAPQFDKEILKVPDGTATELVEYMDKVDARLAQLVQQTQRGPVSPEARLNLMDNLTGLLDARMEAAEKILADDKSRDSQREMASAAVLDSLDSLAQLGRPEAAEKADAFAKKLADDKSPAVRRFAAAKMLDNEIAAISAGEKKDAKELLKHSKVVFSGNPDDVSMRRFMSMQQAAQALIQAEQVQATAELMQLMGEHFVAAEHPQLAQAGGDLLDQAKIIRLDDAMRRVEADQEGADAEMLKLAEQMLTADNVDARTMQVVAMLSSAIEEKHPDLQQKLLTDVKVALQKQLEREDLNSSDLMELSSVAEELGEVGDAIHEKIQKALLAKIETTLSDEEVSPEEIGEIFAEVATQAEYAGNVALAQQLHEQLGNAISKLSEEQAQEELQAQLDAAKKRIGLIGNPLTVEGALLDGTPFDWSKYEGKVVLVDFWATWCGPCLAEIPNILANYDKYQEQGFEVVGVNIDEDPETVVRFFAARGELPWPTVVSSDPETTGPKSPMAEKCGVVSIPFVVLVGADGNVLGIHVRGPELGDRLAEIFPDAAASEEDDDVREVEPNPPVPENDVEDVSDE